MQVSVGCVGDSYDRAIAETLMAFIKPKSFAIEILGERYKTLRLRLWNGSTGSTIDGYWAPLGTFRQQNWNNSTTNQYMTKSPAW